MEINKVLLYDDRLGILFQSIHLANIISSTNERPDGSGSKPDSESRRYEEDDFTICLDKYITSINGFINLLILLLPFQMHKINLFFSLMAFHAFNVPNIELFTWGTVCFSYTLNTYKIRLVYSKNTFSTTLYLAENITLELLWENCQDFLIGDAA